MTYSEQMNSFRQPMSAPVTFIRTASLQMAVKTTVALPQAETKYLLIFVIFKTNK